MLIRLSNNHDLSHLAVVERSAARKFVEYFNNDESYTERTLDHEVLLEAHRNKTLWIAEKSGEIIGFIAATTVDNGLHIEEISVAFDYQGQGLGKTLIETLISDAKNKQCAYVSLTTDLAVPWNKPFYDKIGFKHIELKECAPGLSKILMRDRENSRIPDHRIAMIFTIQS